MLFGRLVIRDVVFLVCLALSQATCSSAAVPGADAAASQAAAPSALRADVAFVCLWWSEAQMEGLNPNAPPPKKTEVRITKWEYSDPVGVPHPDVVDIVVTLANSGNQVLSNLEVDVASEWKEGSLRAAAGAVWSQPRVLRKFPEVSVGSSGQQVLRVTVNLKEKMDSLGTQQKWPYGLRATVTVRDPRSVQPLAQVRAELPIRRAD
jgi:hypothetical protein